VDLKIQSVQTQNFSSSSSSSKRRTTNTRTRYTQIFSSCSSREEEEEEEQQQQQGFRYPGFNSSAATFSFWQVEKQEKMGASVVVQGRSSAVVTPVVMMILALLGLMALLQGAQAETYVVGGTSQEWNFAPSNSATYYSDVWAKGITFRVGDVLRKCTVTTNSCMISFKNASFFFFFFVFFFFSVTECML
jgi:hypothetical protein